MEVNLINIIDFNSIKDFAIVNSNARVTFFFSVQTYCNKENFYPDFRDRKKNHSTWIQKKNVTCIKTKHAHILKCQIVL